jgi:hypothetical protein
MTMKISSAEVAAQTVLPQGQAPDVNRARVYGQTNAPVQTYQIVNTYTLLVTGKNWPSLWHIKLVPASRAA